MEQKTAVEWFLEAIGYKRESDRTTIISIHPDCDITDLIKQAKQMESIQMDSEYRKGWEAAEKSLSKEIEKIHEYYRSHRPI